MPVDKGFDTTLVITASPSSAVRCTICQIFWPIAFRSALVSRRLWPECAVAPGAPPLDSSGLTHTAGLA
jgi:hypothetical protein